MESMKKKIKVLNGFPMGAMPEEAEIISYEVKLEKAKKLVVSNWYESYVGHADTASILTQMLGVPIEFNRCSAVFEIGDIILTCAYTGPRLPEGATSLPEGAKFRFFISEIRKRIDITELYNNGLSVRDIARMIHRSPFYVYSIIKNSTRNYEVSNKIKKLKNLKLRIKNNILNEKDVKLLNTLKQLDANERYSYLKSYFEINEDYEILKEVYIELMKLIG